ncbi:hypothetical protein FRC04_004921 [Tulasnella sp. 424]|nr:hypothetical protein FRC04_004921 [Tulasnella sp. 424]KAG8973476.1 hypothetical protein FRC05_008750 [Tulasnella sp. 425]
MVTTRRELPVSYKDSSDDEMDVDGFVYDDSDEDLRPKRKKAKTTSKLTKRKGKVTARSLMKDLFSALPLDLIYEVFGHLHPSDLLNLARTSKMLRSHLMSKRSVSVWKTAREAIMPPVPECPKDQSEPQWAALLFMLNCTLGRKFYYSPHIEEMGEIVEDFQLRIDAGVKGAREGFDKFMERMKAKAAEQAKSKEALKEWARNAARLRSLKNNQLMEERGQAMIAKLVELGHDTRDVKGAADTWGDSGRHIFYTTTPLSDYAWKRAKPKAEMLVEEAKQRRLDIERRPIREARGNVARSRYDIFKKTYDASPDNLLPHESLITDVPLLKCVIQSDGDDVSPSIFDGAFEKLPDILDDWRRERRIHLAKILLKAQATPGDVTPDPIATEKDGILLLATSFFSACGWARHGNYECRIHWINTLHTHLSFTSGIHALGGTLRPSNEEMSCIRAVPESIQRAKALVQAAGLDPEKATQMEMDEMDARFWCTDCSVLKTQGSNVARNWRNCIIHLQFHNSTDQWKGWEVLSPEDRDIIINRENAVSAFQVMDWNMMAISLWGEVVNWCGYNQYIETA